MKFSSINGILKVDHLLSCIKIYSKWNNDLTVWLETKKCAKENMDKVWDILACMVYLQISFQ